VVNANGISVDLHDVVGFLATGCLAHTTSYTISDDITKRGIDPAT